MIFSKNKGCAIFCFSVVLLMLHPSCLLWSQSLETKAETEIVKKPDTILYLKFDYMDEDWIRDHSGCGHHGRAGDVNLTGGVQGSAAYFNGETSHIRINNDFLLNPGDTLAFSLWYKLADVNTNVYMRVFSKRLEWNIPFGYELELNPSMRRINFCGAATNPLFQGLVIFPVDTLWHHLAGNLYRKNTEIFLDGEKIGYDLQTAMPVYTDTDLAIGASPSCRDHFHGWLDELMLFSRPLEGEEIRLMYLESRK